MRGRWPISQEGAKGREEGEQMIWREVLAHTAWF